MTSPNPPEDHHYIPQFLLSGWADASGFLYRYTEPVPGKIDPKRKPTKAAGFQGQLYSIKGVEPDKAQIVETLFMAPLDHRASQAHKLILGGNWDAFDVKIKSAWSTFIMSLWVRTPHALAAYKEGYKALFDEPSPEAQAKYEAIKKPNDPDTFEEYILLNDPHMGEASAVTSLGQVIVNEPLGRHLNNMIWGTLGLDPAAGSFLMSDEPIIMSNGIGPDVLDAHLVIPISPHKLFVAVNKVGVYDWIAAKRPRDLIRETNTLIVERARSFVVAKDHSQAKFIGNRFGKNRIQGIAHLFAKTYAK